MPIANCLINKQQLPKNEIQELAVKWAHEISIDVKDICLTFVPNCIQGGQQYDVLINLYLPSLWSEPDIKRIQKSLLTLLCNHLETEPSEIFIMTSIIRSGHVVENGAILEW